MHNPQNHSIPRNTTPNSHSIKHFVRTIHPPNLPIHSHQFIPHTKIPLNPISTICSWTLLHNLRLPIKAQTLITKGKANPSIETPSFCILQQISRASSQYPLATLALKIEFHKSIFKKHSIGPTSNTFYASLTSLYTHNSMPYLFINTREHTWEAKQSNLKQTQLWKNNQTKTENDKIKKNKKINK